MKKAGIAVLVVMLALSQATQAEENAHRKLAEELMVIMDVQKNIEQMFQQIKQMQMNQFKNMNLSQEATARAQSLVDRIMTLISREMSWDNLKDEYIHLYVSVFTQDELQGLVEFYKSPLGRKFLAKMPALMQESIQLAQARVRKITPEIQRITEEIQSLSKN
jgi:hypothetical protein